LERLWRREAGGLLLPQEFGFADWSADEVKVEHGEGHAGGAKADFIAFAGEEEVTNVAGDFAHGRLECVRDVHGADGFGSAAAIGAGDAGDGKGVVRLRSGETATGHSSCDLSAYGSVLGEEVGGDGDL